MDQALLDALAAQGNRSGRRGDLRQRPACLPALRHRHQLMPKLEVTGPARRRPPAAEYASAGHRRIPEARSSSKKGSDLHFLAGDPPRIRLYGDLQPLRPERLEKDFVQQTLYEIMPQDRGQALRRARRRGLRLQHGRIRPLPRERHAPAQRHGRGVARHSVEGAVDGAAQAAAGVSRAVPRQQRPDPRHRQDRLGQVDHARRDDRRHQFAHEGPHPHHRGPDRVRAPAQALPHQPARSRRAHQGLRARRCTPACARIRTWCWSASCATTRPSASR